MSSLAILFQRVLKDGRFQYKILKMVFDWTVTLYILVPSLVISGFIYRSWWVELPVWSEFINLPVIAFLLYLISWASRYRTFVKEADEVFLLKYKQKYLGLKLWSYLYSLVKNAISITVAVLAVSPFLHIKHGFSMLEIFSFAFLFIGLSILIMAIKMTISNYFYGWKEKLMVSISFLTFLIGMIRFISGDLFVPNYSIMMSLLFIVVALLLSYPRIYSTRSFHQEVMKENEERMRNIHLIFGAAPELEKPKVIKRSRPILFPKSKRLFHKNLAPYGFYELFIKVVLRNSTYYGGYYKLLAVTAVAIMAIPPLYLKVFILMGFLVFIWIWLGFLWDKVILSVPIGRKYSQHEAYFSARKKACLVLTLPAACILFALFIVSLMWFT